MRKYAITLSENYEDYFDVIDITSMEIVETFSNIQDAKNQLIKLEKINYLKEHDNMCFIYEYGKKRFNLHYVSESVGYYMDCISYDSNGRCLSCTQNYSLNKGLPTENSYTLLSDTCDKALIEITMNEKIECLNKWKHLKGMRKECLQLIKEIGMLHDALKL